jgi:hypothetical protein
MAEREMEGEERRTTHNNDGVPSMLSHDFNVKSGV